MVTGIIRTLGHQEVGAAEVLQELNLIEEDATDQLVV